MQKMMKIIIIIVSFMVFGLAAYFLLGKWEEVSVALINPLNSILDFFKGSGASQVT